MCDESASTVSPIQQPAETEQAASFAEPPFYIVGVGASAGGLEALERMFDHIPVDTGMAFVVVQHLSPDFKSVMDELLSRHTAMEIHRVEDGMPVAPNSIYLIPPKKEMIISDGRLLLTDRDPGQASHLPIDDFFRSLAHDAGRNAVGVILSGTGSDGSRGIRDIHEAGGLVIAQSEASAKFDGMIRSALETGVVDVSVPPEQIGEVLTRYISHPLRSQWQDDTSGPVDESSLERIFRLLQRRHKIDFSYYKPTTIGRRIERRIQLNHNGSLDDYVRQLENDPQELDRLYKDLLIGVTRFFRDHDAFQALEHELPKLLLKTKPGEEFRAWVAACATGEEAYSIAILIHECLEDMNRQLEVKIFATDVHRASLDVAHRGIYPEAALVDLPTRRRERYFTQTEGGWQINPEIRQMIVFAPHNLVKDAPFTKTDLITCRNLLIYLRPPAQKKVLSLFHFGLTTGGLLLLGSSESPGELADEFETIDERAKIYSKRRDVRLPPDVRTFLPDPTAQSRAVPGQPSGAAVSSLQPVYDNLLSRFMPPGVLVDEQREVVHSFGGAGQYLTLRDGRLSHNLLEMVDGDLKLALAGAFQRLAKGEDHVRFGRVSAKGPDGKHNVEVSVSKISERAAVTYYLVTFELVESDPVEQTQSGTIDLADATRDRVSDLEQELRYTKENLQATIEELETSNQELQATNEELVASNEELQSTNEELHSVNEELYTVNAEYQKKISELTELTNDMENLLVSTEVHTLFLDDNFCIRKFTPKMAEVFNLIPSDVGRRIEGFTQNIRCDDLPGKLSRVLDTGERYEEQTQDTHGVDFLLRILPYRSGTKISGTVLTLIDIDELKTAEDRFAHLSSIVESSEDAILSKDLDGRILSWNSAAQHLYGYSEEETVGRSVELIVPPEKREELKSILQRIRRGEAVRSLETQRICKDGSRRDVSLSVSPMYNRAGQVTGSSAIGRDITRRKRAERRLEEEVRNRDNFLAMLSHELRNPLGALLSATHVLESDDVETRTFEEALQVVRRQARHMATLLNDLVDVARITRGQIRLKKQPVDLVELVGVGVETVRPVLDRNEQRLKLDLPEKPVWIDASEDRIQQILVNLLTNAARYSPSGESVTLSVTTEDEFAVLKVRDNGIGIRPEMLNSIFDLFVQAEQSIERSEGGMGVGLALVKRLVELHGGTVEAGSKGPGHGSEFTVRLPRTKPPRPSCREERKAMKIDAVLRVLLIEDNRDARTMFETLLGRRGFEVLTAEDGRSGLELARTQQPDVAVIDIGLPQLDGYEVARRIRADDSLNGIRLIALTGYGQDSDRRKALEAGFDEHLTKPLNPPELLERLNVDPTTREAVTAR